MSVRVIGVDNAVVRHWLTVLRDETTPPDVFRAAVRRVTTLLVPEVVADLPMLQVVIKTPLEEMKSDKLSRRVILVPILRAGVEMVSSFVDLLPDVSVCHVGVERDEEPPFGNKCYYNRLPERFGDEVVIPIDVMNATGQSAVAVMDILRQRGADFIKYVSLIAAPEGIELIQRRHPSVAIYTAARDRGLNEHGYIMPGLGDAGDRINATQPRVRAIV